MKTILQLYFFFFLVFVLFFGKGGYETWKVNEPGMFHLILYVQPSEIPKQNWLLALLASRVDCYPYNENK